MQKEEPVKGCLLAMRQLILRYNAGITEAWKYKMPFFCYNGKMFCYVWVDRKTGQPYLGIVEGKRIQHPALIRQNRSRMKVMFVDPAKDLPVRAIHSIFKMAMKFYR